MYHLEEYRKVNEVADWLERKINEMARENPFIKSKLVNLREIPSLIKRLNGNEDKRL